MIVVDTTHWISGVLNHLTRRVWDIEALASSLLAKEQGAASPRNVADNDFTEWDWNNIEEDDGETRQLWKSILGYASTRTLRMGREFEGGWRYR